MCNWDRQLNANSEVGFANKSDLIYNLLTQTNLTVQAVRVPDEGKLPVSWLAGNQGEYATSTEVMMTVLISYLDVNGDL